MRQLIDWELLSELTSSPGFDEPALWDRFARRYDGFSRLQAQATLCQVQAMALCPGDSVLDVGAGTGRLSLELARRVHRVTALDVSRAMLDILERNAVSAGVGNVTPLHLPWGDAVLGDNLERHDVVVACRSPATRDLRKLHAAARRAVYIFLFAGPSLKQFHDWLMDGIDPEVRRSPALGAVPCQPSGHVLLFNRLAAMGIQASVNYIPDGFTNWYADDAALLADFAWLDVPAGRMAQFKRNLQPFCCAENGGVRLRLTSRSVVLSWSTQAPSADAPAAGVPA